MRAYTLKNEMVPTVRLTKFISKGKFTPHELDRRTAGRRADASREHVRDTALMKVLCADIGGVLLGLLGWCTISDR